jgi:hypothetical protein
MQRNGGSWTGGWKPVSSGCGTLAPSGPKVLQPTLKESTGEETDALTPQGNGPIPLQRVIGAWTDAADAQDS